MKLKSLEISGFKSFADKTKIEFKPGMTGIVGPNGVGKSNIIEALRWAMGEQSAKGLRGEKMQDVIFGGTDKRNALNRAEVSIVFDNTDHYLKTDWSEIRITRRLYRTGESVYQLNGQDARLRDIVNLFMDTGLGKESFSIISQGRVEEIFNSKPSDRRAIIEEVAGVYKYKQNKEHAEKELNQTQDNLDRIQDIFMEVSQRVEPLEKQAVIAKDYLQQKEKYDELDKLFLATGIIKANQELQGLQQQAVEVSNIVSQKQIEIEKLQQNLVEQKDILANNQETKENKQQVYFEYSQQVERLHGLQNVTAQRDENQQETQQQLEQQIVESKTQLKEKQILSANTESKVKTLENDISKLSIEIDELTKQTTATLIAKLENDIQQQQTSYVELVKKQATLVAKNEQLANTAMRSKTDTSDVFGQLTVLAEKIAIGNNDLAQLSAQMTSATNDIQQAEQQVNELKISLKANSEQENTLRNQWYEGLAIIKQAQARLESLKQLEDDYSGFFQGVKNLLSNRNKFSQLIGPVAEVIEVDSKYTKAIETSLGATLQHVIVEDDISATQIVKYLTKNRLGRVTLLPLNVIQARTLNANQVTLLKEQVGFIAVANQIVVTDKKYQKVIDNLLGTTLLAKDIEAARIIAQKVNHRLKVVTLDGQVINAGGSITGGAQRNEQKGLLVKQAELGELEVALKTMQIESNKREEKLIELAANKENQQNKLEKLQGNFVELQTYSSQVAANLATKKLIVEQLIEQQEQLSEKNATQSASIEDLKSLQRTTNTELANLKKAIKDNQNLTIDLQNQLQTMHTNRGALESKLQSKRELLATAVAQKKELSKQAFNLEIEEQRLQTQIDKAQARLALLVKTVDEIALTKTQAALKLKLANENQNNAKQAIKQLDDIIKETQQVIYHIESNLAKLENTYQVERADLLTIKTKINNLLSLVEERTTRLTDEYQLQASDIDIENNNLSQLELQKKLKLLKMGITELGIVNLNAIEEYAQVKERYDFLKQQQDDLIVARSNLFTTMQEMDSTVKERFKVTFDQIANSFEKIFEQMFGGGKAQLRLTDEHNLLTTGIDIMAQPPGKKFQQMSLLSGGERALTAITLLFAILDVRPVPFAILDETEAALDDANVARFSQYLHDFHEDTQFIVITHRKGTMVNADVLYGITMQESGISKMVSVELTELE